MTLEAATAKAEDEVVMDGGHTGDASREMATALSECMSSDSWVGRRRA